MNLLLHFLMDYPPLGKTKRKIYMCWRIAVVKFIGCSLMSDSRFLLIRFGACQSFKLSQI